jgi:hypothetical protein
LTLSLTRLTLPPCSTRPSDALVTVVAVAVAVSVIVVKGSALAALVAVQKER